MELEVKKGRFLKDSIKIQISMYHMPNDQKIQSVKPLFMKNSESE